MTRLARSVFVSFSLVDHVVAEEILDDLKAVGIPAQDVFSSSTPGDSWAIAVDAGISSAYAVIALISKNYVSAPYVFSGLGKVLSSRKRLIPLIIERDAPVPALLAPYVMLDVSDPTTRRAKIRALAADILRDGQNSGERSNQLASVEAQLRALREASLIEEYRYYTRLKGRKLLTLYASASLVLVTLVVLVVLGVSSSSQVLLSAGVASLSAMVGAAGGGLLSVVGRNRSIRHPDGRVRAD